MELLRLQRVSWNHNQIASFQIVLSRSAVPESRPEQTTCVLGAKS